MMMEVPEHAIMRWDKPDYFTFEFSADSEKQRRQLLNAMRDEERIRIILEWGKEQPGKLKPCPFCGAPAKFFRGFAWGVECTFCDVHILGYSNRNDATRAWNRRYGEKDGNRHAQTPTGSESRIKTEMIPDRTRNPAIRKDETQKDAVYRTICKATRPSNADVARLLKIERASACGRIRKLEGEGMIHKAGTKIDPVTKKRVNWYAPGKGESDENVL